MSDGEKPRPAVSDRELDALVAEVVMGYSMRHFGMVAASDHDLAPVVECPEFCTTGDGLLAVIDAMGKRGFRVEVDVLPPEAPSVEFKVMVKATKFSTLEAVQDHAQTAPRAVCLAALRALGEEVK